MMGLFLYLSQLKENKITWYAVDSATGDLARQGDIATPGEPGVQGTSPDRKILYVAMRSTGALCSFRIDPHSGRLDLLHALDTGLADPGYMATDRTGRYLITPYYESACVTVYAIDDDGVAREPLVSRLDTAPHAHGIAVSADNRHVFVPHTCPGNAVWQLVFDKGQLRTNAIPRVDFDRDIGPRHLHLHPANGCAYSVNEQDNSATAYRFAAETGTLTPFQTLPTVPEDHQGGACARMEIHPSGHFLYAANRGHDSLAGFRIGADGALASIGHFATEANPRSFHFDPAGRFLYAAGESSDKLVSYHIADDGALAPLRRWDTGRVPWWVQVVEPS